MKRSKHLALVALAAVLLGACSSAVEPTATQAATQDRPLPTATQALTQDQPPPTEHPVTRTSVPTEAVTMPPPTATESSQVATATGASQPATDTPEPADVFAFLEVGPDEWARGPDDALVTIIEYADFQ